MTTSLKGKRILVTRPKRQGEAFAEKLSNLGAEAVLMPSIQITPPESSYELDTALLRLGSYDWVVLTSVNGVEALRTRMLALGVSIEQLASRRLAVIGPATAAALERFCRKPDVMPDTYVAEAIFRHLGDVRGKRFLLARADIARPDLAIALRNAGAEVTEAVAYKIVSDQGAEVDLERAPDFITLTSSSAARATIERLRHEGLERWLETVPLVCIGPITANTVQEMGYAVAAIPSAYTTDGLIEALLDLSQQETTHA